MYSGEAVHMKVLGEVGQIIVSTANLSTFYCACAAIPIDALHVL